MANGRSGSRRRKQLTGAKTQSFYIDASGIDGIADMLDTLSDGVKEAIRPVAYAGIRVVYERILANVDGMGMKTGNLKSAIYHAYMREASEPGKREMYRASWNHIKAPHGRLLEWGWVQTHKVYMRDGKWFTRKDAPLEQPIQRPGFGFIRRAYAALPEAEAAMKKDLADRIAALSYYGA